MSPRTSTARARPDRGRTATSSEPHGAARGGRRRPGRRRGRRCGSSSRGSGARCAAILVTHGALRPHRRRRRPRRGDRRAGDMAGRRARRARAARRLHAARRARSGPYTPEVLLARRRDARAGRHRVRDARASRATRPAHLAFAADGALFSGDVLFAGSVGRTDLPGGDWETLLASIRMLVERFPPETVVYSGPRAGDDARARARDATRSSPSCAPPRREDSRRRAGRTTSCRPTSRAGSGSCREVERLCRALRLPAGSRRPAFEDTELFARTSGAGSDVVQKEMYTFEDRGGRSLTLRPGGDGADRARLPRARPAPRAAAAEALHDRRRCTGTRAPQKGRYREHWQLSVEAIGSDDPALDAELIQLYDELARRRSASTRLRARAELDRRRATAGPRYVERLRRVARRARRRARRGRAREARRRARCASSTSKDERVRRGARGRAEDRRVALRRVPRALRRGARRTSTPTASSYELVPTLVRGLDYYTRTAFEFVDDELDGAQSTICGGGRYDGLSRRSAGRRRRASASAPASSACSSRSSDAPPDAEPRDRRLLRRSTDGGRRAEVLAAAGRAPRAQGLRARHRLRRPLAQGPADPGAAASARGRPCVVERATAHGAAPTAAEEDVRSARSQSWRQLARMTLARPHVRRGAARARRPAADARRLGRHAPRPRRPRLHRPARRERASASS